MVLEARTVLKANGINCDEFLCRNLDAVEHLLPLYDAKFCWNTRYQLTGFTRLKFVADRPVDMVCESLKIMIPGEEIILAELAPEGKRNRWNTYLERREGRLLQFNILQSLASFPEVSEYELYLNSEQDFSFKIFVADGDYDPMLSGMPTQRWRQIDTMRISTGKNIISGTIPFDEMNLFAYPTNFKKKINNIFVNAYHVIHVVDLAVLYRFTGRQVFAKTALNWLEYMSNWPGITKLNRDDLSLKAHLYGDDLERVVESYLSRVDSVI
jgi:hypothetical protein